jgi:hypothetical protein
MCGESYRMDTPAYDIVFSGALLAGRDPAQVRAELARLFKTDAAGIERLFCSQPVIIKKGADRQTADKYRAALEKAGAVCEIRARPPADKAADAPERMILAPAGAMLTTPARITPPVYDLDHMSLAAVGMDILEGVDTAAAPPLYDLAAYSVAPPGSDLDTATQPAPAVLPDIGALTMAEAGSDLDTRSTAAPVVLPDISSISLAPAGTAVIRPDEMKVQPSTPDISDHHLALEPARGSAR